MVFILRGELGAVTSRIVTGWVARPLITHYARSGGPQARRDKPGVDAGVADIYPDGAFTGAHSYLRRKSSVSQDDCDVLPGGKCWCTGGYLITDQVLKTLVTMGSDGVWHQLESYYDEWIAKDPVAEKENADG